MAAAAMNGFACGGSDPTARDDGSEGASGDVAADAAPLPARFPYEASGPPGDGGAGIDGAGRPNILLITLDTARRDRFSCYGHPRETTPHVDALAREGILFEDCVTSIPVTLPSHATILTGLEPYQHGVRNNGSFSLEDEFLTVAEVLLEEGYRTGAVIGAYPVIGRFGLAQGFESYDDTLTLEVADTPVTQRRAEEVTSRGLRWLAAPRAAPWFLWLHYFDPHDPYTPPEPWADAFRESPYDGEMAYMDSHLGGLFRELKRRGLWNNTFILLTADHGEGLGDHGESSHSLFLYKTTMSVPLILKFPLGPRWEGDLLRGRRIDGLAATADIFPTLLSLVGAGDRIPAGATGQDLTALAAEGGAGRAAVYMETLVPQLDYGWSPLYALREADWKLIFGPNPELYDLREDPGEERDLYGSHPERVEEMRGRLLALSSENRMARQVAMDEETVEALRSLGYSGGAGGAAEGPLKDPKEMLWALAAFDEARGALLRGEMREVMDLLSGVLVRDETNRFAMRMLSHVLLASGFEREAADLCARILDEDAGANDAGVTRLRRAQALVSAGLFEEGLDLTERIRSADPGNFDARLVRAEALAGLKRFEEAERLLMEMSRERPKSVRVPKLLARLYVAEGRIDEAARVYEEAVAKFPADPDLPAGLAGIRIDQVRPTEAIDLLQKSLRLVSYHAKANFHMGTIMARGGKPGPATAFFERAVRSQPGKPLYQLRLGSHCLAGGNVPKAIEHLSAAIERGSNDPAAYAGLGVSYARTGRPDEARRMLETALALDPPPALLDAIGREMSALSSQP